MALIVDFAKKEKQNSIVLDSTITAVPFYQYHGFYITNHDHHIKFADQVLRCISMKKDLD